MATASTSSLPDSSSHTTTTSPHFHSIKKVLSGGRRRSIDTPSEHGPRSSIDSISLDKGPSTNSTQSSPSRDGSIKSGASVLRKLVPGHDKRQRRRDREGELQAVAEMDMRGRSPELTTEPPPAVTAATNRSTSSLLTDNSENDTPPPLISRDSHMGYLTTSSPLIKTVTDRSTGPGTYTNRSTSASTEAFPVIVEPEVSPIPEPSPRSMPKLESTPVLPAPGLIDKADTLRVSEAVDNSRNLGRLRGVSPARKLKEAFSKTGKSPRSSPERPTRTTIFGSTKMAPGDESVNNSKTGSYEARNENGMLTSKLEQNTNRSSRVFEKPLPPLDTDLEPPRTPPSAMLTTPMTTVTPPTPTENTHDTVASPSKSTKGSDSDSSNVTVSDSGNMISHRRVRSASSITHGKSKLSTSMTAPLTPTLEEVRTTGDRLPGSRNMTPGGSFFSNWVSAAQNAATTLTNLTGQNRSRTGTTGSDPSKAQTSIDQIPESPELTEQNTAKKQLAVETLGSGNLDFSHFNINGTEDNKSASTSRVDLSGLGSSSDLTQDEAQAKVEDIMAKRAVSAAYEKPGDSSHVPEVQDPIVGLRQTHTMDSVQTGGTLTPPNGSLFEEADGVKRSNSVRSKIASRRSRGSSITTGQSTIGAMISASTATLVNPVTGSKMTGFTPAPKARNRAFHQQFRSVPEDDYLIEDYSCALQKEILLAGRIYISEGHICFSSNILGWVTTLIISFEEIVSIEREHTAMIIPNAIAIQTLHARHTFRSLLSREATFDLMIGIWKVNHPASFQKSVNGKQMLSEQAEKQAAETVDTNGQSADASDEDSEEESDSDDDDDEDHDGSAPSLIGSIASADGNEVTETKTVTRKPSGPNGTSTPVFNNTVAPPAGEVVAAAAVVAGVPAVVDFPGPTTHAPTDCTDNSTHYDKIIKDEIISAPLGKIYSLLYGPQSGTFVRKFIVDEGKCLDLVMEDDKKGLSNEIKSRQYSYIKPLGGSIGPKQTKCITTETLDFFDLEKSVSVTCTTQTPDVPSGSAFSTKTRYCLSWAPGNATRLQMNCTIEWTAKSWLKGPIEKGANDGQQQYGDGLVKALKATLGRSRATTVGSKGAKTKKKKKGEKRIKSDRVEGSATTASNWGPLEPVRPALEPFVAIIRPVMRMEVIVAVLSIMVFTMWFRGTTNAGTLGRSGSLLDTAQKMTAYEELWQHEESELWDWLSDRAGVSQVMLTGHSSTNAEVEALRRRQAKARKSQLSGKDVAAKLRAEGWSRQELQNAVQVTRERLDAIQQVMADKIAYN